MTTEELISNQVIFPASKIKEIDLRIEAQIHTDWTDGANSINEMQNVAQEKNLRVLVFSEHTSFGSGSWYSNFVTEIRSLPISDLDIYIGTEVKIKDFSGALDLDWDVERLTQIVLASVHRFPDINGQPIDFSDTDTSVDVCDTELKLMIAAIKSKRPHIIAHPFGMSLARFHREPSDQQWYELIKVAIEHEVALEFNSKYHKDNFGILTRYIKSNCLITIGSDAHSKNEVGNCSSKIIKFLGLK